MYAGLEFGAECYCGHKIQAPNASESECNMECKGEKSNLCGGANRLSIYRLELSQESARRCECDTLQQQQKPPLGLTGSSYTQGLSGNTSAHAALELFCSIKNVFRFKKDDMNILTLSTVTQRCHFVLPLFGVNAAGCCVVFTCFSPRELCYLCSPASCGLHPKHYLLLETGLKGRADN